MLTASDEPPAHELQHLHWNCFLLKTLAFESTAKRNSFGNTGEALIFQSDDSEVFAPGFVSNNIPGSKIGVHRVPLGRVTITPAMGSYHSRVSGEVNTTGSLNAPVYITALRTKDPV
jgi:hypothetical protein